MTSRTRNISISVTALVTFLLGVGAWAATHGADFVDARYAHQVVYDKDRAIDSLNYRSDMHDIRELLVHLDADVHNPKRKP